MRLIRLGKTIFSNNVKVILPHEFSWLHGCIKNQERKNLRTKLLANFFTIFYKLTNDISSFYDSSMSSRIYEQFCSNSRKINDFPKRTFSRIIFFKIFHLRLRRYLPRCYDFRKYLGQKWSCLKKNTALPYIGFRRKLKECLIPKILVCLLNLFVWYEIQKNHENMQKTWNNFIGNFFRQNDWLGIFFQKMSHR